MDYYPAVALVAVVGGFWGWSWLQRRRLRTAVAEAAAALNGRYEPGGAVSGGTLYAKVAGRDVVFRFALRTSRRPESTTVIGCLRKPVVERLELRGPDAVARAPLLERYSRFLAPVVLRVESNRLSVELIGVVRDSRRMVELAELVAALADEVDRTL